MSVVATLLLIGITLMLVCNWLAYRQLQGRLEDFEASVDAFVVNSVEQQVTLENLLNVTATSVEDMHRVLTDVSFDVLEAIPSTREAGKRMREVHDVYARGMYSSVRAVGKGLGILKTELSTRRRQQIIEGETGGSDKSLEPNKPDTDKDK